LGTDGGIDLMIVDIPEDLPVPMVSSPPTSVPDWNSEHKSFLSMVFDIGGSLVHDIGGSLVHDIGGSLVHDNGMLLLFHKDDLKLRADIRGYSKAYNFSILKEWTEINYLPITSGRDASKTVSGSNLVICIILLDTCISILSVADYIPCYIHL
jgi:hypothetical protein